MPTDDSDHVTDHDTVVNGRSVGRPERPNLNHWDLPLTDHGWHSWVDPGEDVELLISTKRWDDGTTDIVIAPAPFPADGAMPTAYAHRHGAAGVPPLSATGPGDLIVSMITTSWSSP